MFVKIAKNTQNLDLRSQTRIFSLFCSGTSPKFANFQKMNQILVMPPSKKDRNFKFQIPNPNSEYFWLSSQTYTLQILKDLRWVQIFLTNKIKQNVIKKSQNDQMRLSLDGKGNIIGTKNHLFRASSRGCNFVMRGRMIENPVIQTKYLI